MDASGSMAGKTFDLGIATASIILDSLGDNDFINLIIFSDVTKSVVPCFKDKLVRATPDNVKEIKAALKGVKCENVANFTAGFVYAFELLQRVIFLYRIYFLLLMITKIIIIEIFL